jgi:hypothetical protein
MLDEQLRDEARALRLAQVKSVEFDKLPDEDVCFLCGYLASSVDDRIGFLIYEAGRLHYFRRFQREVSREAIESSDPERPPQ